MRHGLLTAVSALLVVSCGGEANAPGVDDAAGPVPAEFVPACGRPGTQVQVLQPRGLVQHVACDLTGVTLLRADGGGAVVPARGEGVATSTGLSVRRAANGDVTYELLGDPGNG